MQLQFEWDANKKASNFIKHGVSFEEAITVFDDPIAGIFDDPLHSIEEKRELIIGYSVQRKLLIVSFTELENGIIRLISARYAEPKEIRKHEQQKK